MKIALTCPNCGNDEFDRIKNPDTPFRCKNCLMIFAPEEMTSTVIGIEDTKKENTLPKAKTYNVRLAISTRYNAEVKAKSLDEAIEKAYEKFEEANMGDLEYADAEVCHVKDKAGNYYM